QLGRAHRLVDPEHLEGHFVLGVVDPRDDALDLELPLGHLTAHEVVLVIPGHRRQQIRAGRSGLLEGAHLAPIPEKGRIAELLLQQLISPPLLLDDRDLQAGRHQGLGEVISDLAPADDDDIHVGRSFAGLRSPRYEWARISGRAWYSATVRKGRSRKKSRHSPALRSVGLIVSIPSSLYASARSGS